MNHQACFSMVSKGFLTAAAVAMLVVGAEQPDSQPLSQTQYDPVERIRMYDAQPVGIMQTGPAPETLDYSELREGQRWVF